MPAKEQPKDYGDAFRALIGAGDSAPEAGATEPARGEGPKDYGQQLRDSVRRDIENAAAQGGLDPQSERDLRARFKDYGPMLRGAARKARGEQSSDEVTPRSLTPTRRPRSEISGSPATPGDASDPFGSAQGSVDNEEPRGSRQRLDDFPQFSETFERPSVGVEQPVVEQIVVEENVVEQNGVEEIDGLSSGVEEGSNVLPETSGAAQPVANGGGDGLGGVRPVPEPGLGNLFGSPEPVEEPASGGDGAAVVGESVPNGPTGAEPPPTAESADGGAGVGEGRSPPAANVPVAQSQEGRSGTVRGTVDPNSTGAGEESAPAARGPAGVAPPDQAAAGPAPVRSVKRAQAKPSSSPQGRRGTAGPSGDGGEEWYGNDTPILMGAPRPHCCYRLTVAQRCDRSPEFCLPALDGIDTVNGAGERLAQRGDWWCYEHAQEISEKLVMGPLAQRVGEPWSLMVRWGRSVLQTRQQYEAQTLQRQEDARRLSPRCFDGPKKTERPRLRK